jgi:ribonuclease HII
MNPRGRTVCGVDEAGRGPLAGPVFAACVVLDERSPIDGLADSKSLSTANRERLAAEIRAHCAAFAIAFASPEEIDRLNILQASLLAMRRAVGALGMVPAKVLVDGSHCPRLACPARAIVRGDVTVPAISAASILAKTARDAHMRLLHVRYPDFGFDRHKGYPTPQHLAALRRFGPTPEHRRSFAPVRALLAGG